MLTPYIGPIGTAASIFPIIALAVLLPMIVVHYWRFGRLHGFRALVFYSFIFFAITAYFLVILPLPDRFDGFCEVYSRTVTPQLEPFGFINDILTYDESLTGLALLQSLPRNSAFLQAFFNFLLLLPLGFYLRYYFGYGFFKSAVISFGVTLFFELTQLSGLYGLYPCPYRWFDVDDLILNTAGALVGYGVASTMDFLPDLSKPAEGPIPVTALRRGVAFVLDGLLYTFTFGIVTVLIAIAEAAPVVQDVVDLLGVALWFVVVPTLWRGYTPGKRLTFMRIVHRDGGPVAWWQLAIRYGVLFYSVPVLTGLILVLRLPGWLEAVGVIGVLLAYLLLVVLWSIIRRDDRGLHDMLARTRQVVSWHDDR